MTEEFDFEREAELDSVIGADSIVESSVVPIESTAEEALAAVANAIPAAGGPIVVDPYAVLGTTTAAATAAGVAGAPSDSQPYVAPTHPGSAPHVNYSAPYPGAHYGGGYPGHPYQVRPTTDGFAIAALVCGVAGLLGLAPLLGSILAVVFGVLALQRIGRTGAGGRGMAIAGIVTGGAGFLFSILLGLLLGLTGLFGLFSWGSVM
jgi:hypothetical protein